MIFFGFIFFFAIIFSWDRSHSSLPISWLLIFSCTFNSRFSYSFFHPHVYSSINWFSFISVTLILRFLNISEFSITLNGISHIPLNCSLTQDSAIKQQRTTFFTHSLILRPSSHTLPTPASFLSILSYPPLYPLLPLLPDPRALTFPLRLEWPPCRPSSRWPLARVHHRTWCPTWTAGSSWSRCSWIPPCSWRMALLLVGRGREVRMGKRFRKNLCECVGL